MHGFRKAIGMALYRAGAAILWGKTRPTYEYGARMGFDPEAIELIKKAASVIVEKDARDKRYASATLRRAA